MIVVFGSLHADIVMQVDKLPLPGETTLCPAYHLVPGGKGANQAIAASQAGSIVKLFGCVGDDAFGKLVLTRLETSAVDLTYLMHHKGAATGCALVCMDPQGKTMTTVASGVNRKLQARDVPDSVLTQDTTLLLQMETLPEENWALIRRAKRGGARVVLNLAPASLIPSDIFPLLDVLIVNQMDAAFLALHLGTEVVAPAAAARYVVATYGITCVVTLGAEGALICSSAGTWKIKAMEDQPLRTEDAFVGVLAASLDAGCDLALALRRASAASGLTSLTEGGHLNFPTDDKIRANLKKIPPPRQVT